MSSNKLAPTKAGKASTTRRRSSSLLGHLQQETLEDENDQAAATNINADWVNKKGAWAIHLVIIAVLLVLYNGIPGVSPEMSWTLTNISYVIGSFIMFHLVTGVPFDFNAGAYDRLTMWEQIDYGDQYTPTKKFLLGVPIGLFLLSTHFTHYDLAMFLMNFVFCVVSVLPKLPSAHRLRIGPIEDAPTPTAPQHRRIPSSDLKKQS